MLDQHLLEETYGGHVIVLPGRASGPSSTTRITTTTRRPASATSTTAAADVLDLILDPMAYGFMQRGLVAAVLVGIVCAVMGAFVVLQAASRSSATP